jgi:hypothetical protein
VQKTGSSYILLGYLYLSVFLRLAVLALIPCESLALLELSDLELADCGFHPTNQACPESADCGTPPTSRACLESADYGLTTPAGIW